jgi:hypothetical protein
LKGGEVMKLTKMQMKLIFDKSPETKKLIEEMMPQGYDAYLIIREKEDGTKQPVISFRSE